MNTQILNQFLNELKRISNRLQFISDLYALSLSKQYPNDKDMTNTIKELMHKMRNAELV